MQFPFTYFYCYHHVITPQPKFFQELLANSLSIPAYSCSLLSCSSNAFQLAFLPLQWFQLSRSILQALCSHPACKYEANKSVLCISITFVFEASKQFIAFSIVFITITVRSQNIKAKITPNMHRSMSSKRGQRKGLRYRLRGEGNISLHSLSNKENARLCIWVQTFLWENESLRDSTDPRGDIAAAFAAQGPYPTSPVFADSHRRQKHVLLGFKIHKAA